MNNFIKKLVSWFKKDKEKKFVSGFYYSNIDRKLIKTKIEIDKKDYSPNIIYVEISAVEMFRVHKRAGNNVKRKVLKFNKTSNKDYSNSYVSAGNNYILYYTKNKNDIKLGYVIHSYSLDAFGIMVSSEIIELYPIPDIIIKNIKYSPYKFNHHWITNYIREEKSINIIGYCMYKKLS